MRKSVVLALLSAAALVPAAAQAQDDGQDNRPPVHKQWNGDGARAQGRGDGQHSQDRRNETRGDAQVQVHAQVQAPAMPVQPAARVDQPRDQGGLDQARAPYDNRRDWRGGANGSAQGAVGYQGPYRGNANQVPPDQLRPDQARSDPDGSRAAQWHGDGRGNGNWSRDDHRGQDGQWNRDPRQGGQWNGNPGWNDPRHGAYHPGGNWNRDWRHDRRYDWNGYRAQNRYAYHLPRYYAPRGWGYGYRRFSIGVSLNGSLFGQNYWIDDPWSYRLPDAYGPYRWVRYYNDALLVDLNSGRVVDTVYDIFD